MERREDMKVLFGKILEGMEVSRLVKMVWRNKERTVE